MSYIGEIRMFAGNFAPRDWMFCNGQTLAIIEYETLFNLIGTTYGGDGQNTFNLPNLQSRVPIHMGTGPDGTTYQLGEIAGTERETLTVQQIPLHTHVMSGSSDQATNTSPSGQVLGQNPLIQYFRAGAANQTMNAQSITPDGGSQPHENCQPFLCINYIIALLGLFPPPQ